MPSSRMLELHPDSVDVDVDARRRSAAEDQAPPGPAAPAAAPAAGDTGLAFNQAGGPLVAVCGLHGGAGTSTLAHAIAAAAALESTAPVLLCETDDAAGDIARLTGTRSPWTLAELAAARATATKPDGPTVARAGALRVIAGAPRAATDTHDAIAPFLHAARARHGLTVIDTGTIRAPGARDVMRACTHVIWVTIARPGAADHAHELLTSDLLPPLTAQRILAVRGGRRGRDRAVRQAARELRQRAPGLSDDLVFIADDGALSALTAIAQTLSAP